MSNDLVSMLTWQSENASACVAYSPPGAMTSDAARNRFSGVENDAAPSRQILGRPVVTRKAKFYHSQTVTEHHMVGQVWGSGWWLHRAQLEGTQVCGSGRPRGGAHLRAVPPSIHDGGHIRPGGGAQPGLSFVQCRDRRRPPAADVHERAGQGAMRAPCAPRRRRGTRPFCA